MQAILGNIDSFRAQFIGAVADDPATMRVPGINDTRIPPPSVKRTMIATTNAQHRAGLLYLLTGIKTPGVSVEAPVTPAAGQEWSMDEMRDPRAREWLPPGYFEPHPAFPEGTLQNHASSWPAAEFPRQPMGVYRMLPPAPSGSLPILEGLGSPDRWSYAQPRIERTGLPTAPWSPQSPTIVTEQELAQARNEAAQMWQAQGGALGPGLSGMSAYTPEQEEAAVSKALRSSTVVLGIGALAIIVAAIIRRKVG